MAKTYEQYKNGKFSFSFLKQFAQSPLHAKAYMERAFKSTPAMIFGQMVHAQFAGQFDEEFIVWNEMYRPELEKTMASAKNKAWKRQINEEALDSNRTLVSADEVAIGEQMIESIQANKIGRQIMEADCDIEKVFENDKFTGRLDRVDHKRKLIIDLKTTMKINTRYIFNDIRKFGTHAQAALYSRLLPGYEVMLLFVEKSEPFDVLPVVFELDSELIKEGDSELRIWYNQAKAAFENNEWGGVSPLFPDNIMYCE